SRAIDSSSVSISFRSHAFLCLFFTIQPPPRSTLFPYTTLFRSLTRHAATSRVRFVRGDFVKGRSRSHRGSANAGLRFGEAIPHRSEEHTSELQSHLNLVCRLLLEKKKNTRLYYPTKH